MRLPKNTLLPVFMLLMLVAMPLAESAASDLPPPQATPIVDDAPIAIEGELVPPAISEVCGPDNDEIVPAESQPEGVNPQPEISAWSDGQATLTYSPLDGYAFPDGGSNTILVDEIDTDPCEEATPPAMRSLSQPMNQSVVPTVTFGYPSGMYNLPNSNENTFSVDYDYTGFVFNVPGVRIPNDSDMRVDFKIRVHDGEYFRVLTQQRSSNVRDNSMVMDIDHSESFRNSCLAGHGHIEVEARLEFFHTGGNSLYLDSGRIIQIHSVPCSANYTPPAPSLQHNVCGTNNDSINIPNEYGLAISDSGWQDGVRTITYPNESWLIYPDGFQEKHTFDDNQPCSTTASFTGPTSLYGLDDESQIVVTGNYDVSSIWPSEGLTADVRFVIYKPRGNSGSIMYFSNDVQISSSKGDFSVSTDRSDAWFDKLCLYPKYHDAGSLKIDVMLRFYDQNTNVWSYEEEDLVIPCSVSLVPLDATADNTTCGYVDERIFVPTQDGISGHTISWNDNVATIDYTVEPGYEIVGGPYTVTITDPPCETEPVPDPIHTQHCTQDTITLAGPVDGVTYSTDSGWIDGVYTVEISPLPGWVLPADQTTKWEFDDEPCTPTITYDVPEKLELLPNANLFYGVSWEFDGQPFDYPDEEMNMRARFHYPDTGWNDQIFLWMESYNWVDSKSLPIAASEQAAAQEACIAGEGSIALEIEFFATHAPNPTNYIYEHEGFQGEIPCTVNLTPNAASIDNDVCGYVDKRIVVPQQQGITGHEISWEGNIATIAYTAATPYVITGGPFTIEVSGEPCVTDEVPVFYQDEVCGEDNNIIKGDFAAIPEGVFVDTSEVWTDGVFRIWVTPLPGWVLPEDTKTEYTFEDKGDCEIEGLKAPIHTEICGKNNDTVQLPAEVDHVTITSSGDMSTDGEMTVTFIPDQHYKLPADIDDVYEFTDPGDCMVTPIPPAAPTTVCGPDNDILTIPNQPTGVVIEDSGWMDGERTLELIPAEGYVFPENTTHSLTSTDAADPCLIVTFETSDGGSIEGAPYSIYAPVASQMAPAPYIEGEIGPGNQIAFGELITGTYRLVTAPEGYEPVDVLIDIAADGETEELVIALAAVQPEATPTQVPVPPDAPGEPDKPAEVTRLPETGTGSSSGFGPMAIAGLLAAMVLAVIGNRRSTAES